MLKNDKVVLQGKMIGNLYKLQGRVEISCANLGHRANNKDRHLVTQVWRVKAKANESLCVDGNIGKKEYELIGFSGTLLEKIDDEEKKCARKRVYFATNLVADVFG